MRLRPCFPFNYNNYTTLIQHFINFTTEYIQNNEINGHIGWVNQLMSYSYSFDNANYITGIERRFEFHTSLREAITQEQQDRILTVVNAIMRWGGLKNYNINDIPEIQIALQTLDEIDNGHPNNWNNNLIGKRITAITKIFEMYNPKLWSIYDSRVGKGIQRLVSFYEPNLANISDYLRFQCPPGRNRFPIHGFRQISTSRQAILGFLYASWLFRAIANQLNEANIPLPEIVIDLQGSERWAVYHIEMIFFMFGK
jgi:hypothetical protein